MTNREKLIKLIAQLIDNNTDKAFSIGIDCIRITNNGNTLEVLSDDGDSDVVITAIDQILR